MAWIKLARKSADRRGDSVELLSQISYLPAFLSCSRLGGRGAAAIQPNYMHGIVIHSVVELVRRWSVLQEAGVAGVAEN